jgi:hypothetical protein
VIGRAAKRLTTKAAAKYDKPVKLAPVHVYEPPAEPHSYEHFDPHDEHDYINRIDRTRSSMTMRPTKKETGRKEGIVLPKWIH